VFPAILLAAVLSLAGTASTCLAQQQVLVGLGSKTFRIDPSATTSRYTQSLNGIVFGPSASLGDTLGGSLGAGNWSSPNFQQFGIIMSITGPNPNLPFHLEILDTRFAVLASLEGTTAGVGSAPVFVPLRFTSGDRSLLTSVGGLQWTWDGSANIQVVLSSLAVSTSASDAAAPKVSLGSFPKQTKASYFTLKGTTSDDVSPQILRHRVRAPGAAEFGAWSQTSLPGNEKQKDWQRQIKAPAAGRWQVQVEVLDAAGNRSARPTATILVDRQAPVAEITSPMRANRTAYTLKARLSDNINPVQIQYRLKSPPMGSFSPWRTVSLPGTVPTKDWSQGVRLSLVGSWRIEVRAWDAAKNASAVSSVTVTRR
jgi:hypothetical protein